MDIDTFLNLVRQAIDSSNFQMKYSEKYHITMAKLGILFQDAIDDIYNLTDKENWIGPEEDRDEKFRNGPIYKCIKYLHNEKIYIKLKIVENRDNFLLIMSYHLEGMHNV